MLETWGGMSRQTDRLTDRLTDRQTDRCVERFAQSLFPPFSLSPFSLLPLFFSPPFLLPLSSLSPPSSSLSLPSLLPPLLPQATDETFLLKLNHHCINHAHFESRASLQLRGDHTLSPEEFRLVHYAGKVQPYM